MMKRFLMACLFVCSVGFGQTANPQESNGGLQLSEEDVMMLQMLLMNDLFRDNFVQSCTLESIEWLGASWAEKTCSCAYDNLAKNSSLLLEFLRADENSDSEQLDKMGYNLLQSCLPKQFPPEMESAIIRECMNGGVKKSVCDCVVQKVKKKYTVRTFMKDVLESPAALEKEFTDITVQCGTK